MPLRTCTFALTLAALPAHAAAQTVPVEVARALEMWYAHAQRSAPGQWGIAIVTTEGRLVWAANPNEPLAWLWRGLTHTWRGNGAEAVQCSDRALSLSPLDPMIYYFNSAAGQANLISERYERAIELSNRSLRENRLHTPTLRTLAAALVLSGRIDEARQTMGRLRELEPGLTVSAFRARYPGRDSPQASRFAEALQAAGLPA